MPAICTGEPGMAVGAGRSGRVGPVKVPSIWPLATPCAEETVSDPATVVYPTSPGSRGVSWMIALVNVLDAGSPGMNPWLGASESVCSEASAGSAESNWINRMYLRDELLSWLESTNRDALLGQAGRSRVHALTMCPSPDTI